MARPESVSLFQKGLIVAIAAIAMVAAALLLWHGAAIILLGFAGILLAIALRLPVDALIRRARMPSVVAFLLVFLGLAVLLAGLGWFVVPRLSEQVAGLRGELTKAYEQVVDRLERSPSGRFLLDSLRQVPQGQGDGRLLTRAAGILSTVAGAIGSITLILFTGFFLAVDPSIYREGFLHLIPPRHRKRVRSLLEEIHRTLSWWLLGRFAAMALVGVLSAIGLALLGIPLALALGVLAGIFSFIPYIGPILGAIPAVLIAFGQGPLPALYVVLLYTGIQLVENNLLTPLIEQRTVQLPPALGLTAGLLLAILFGVPGLFLATPLLAVVIVLVRQLYVEEVING